MTEQEFRDRIVRVAQEWCGTPYHLNACLKGIGADCARLLLGVLAEAGAVDSKQIEVFSRDWFCHSKEDAYLLRILRHANKIAETISYPTLDVKPGCLVLLKAAKSRVWNHGAIATRWPLVVHALHPVVEEINASTHPMWQFKQVAIFDPWPKFDEARRAA